MREAPNRPREDGVVARWYPSQSGRRRRSQADHRERGRQDSARPGEALDAPEDPVRQATQGGPQVSKRNRLAILEQHIANMHKERPVQIPWIPEIDPATGNYRCSLCTSGRIRMMFDDGLEVFTLTCTRCHRQYEAVATSSVALRAKVRQSRQEFGLDGAYRERNPWRPPQRDFVAAPVAKPRKPRAKKPAEVLDLAEIIRRAAA